ncbi:hypothetical protein [Rhizobium metallidurans]|uniref:Uncharacterized protein n=1 Tax=Rhizobium metallidurans TaxID=1265931 RepID=A0A7W6CRF4_9HYPH|nr:hypothetical protein [Rhizobium metallidurans]MBB3965837.1 hypothetical protein [Rhizobium metallidurans]
MSTRLSASEQEFAARLEAMSDVELFETRDGLESTSERTSFDKNCDTFAKIVLTESVIERRFPGQLLQPYKAWRKYRI